MGITLAELPEAERVWQLAPARKQLSDLTLFYRPLRSSNFLPDQDV